MHAVQLPLEEHTCVCVRGVFFFVSHLNIKMDETMITTENQILPIPITVLLNGISMSTS